MATKVTTSFLFFAFLGLCSVTPGWCQPQEIIIQHKYPNSLHPFLGSSVPDPFASPRKPLQWDDLLFGNPEPRLDPSERMLLEEQALLLREQRLLLEEQRRALLTPEARLAEDIQRSMPEIEKFLTGITTNSYWISIGAEEKHKQFLGTAD